MRPLVVEPHPVCGIARGEVGLVCAVCLALYPKNRRRKCRIVRVDADLVVCLVGRLELVTVPVRQWCKVEVRV
jgi:hypothetical protein